MVWENQVSTHAATLAAKPSSGWHVWMICRCLTVLPVTAGLVHFVFTPICGRCRFFRTGCKHTGVPTRHTRILDVGGCHLGYGGEIPHKPRFPRRLHFPQETNGGHGERGKADR